MQRGAARSDARRCAGFGATRVARASGAHTNAPRAILLSPVELRSTVFGVSRHGVAPLEAVRIASSRSNFSDPTRGAA